MRFKSFIGIFACLSLAACGPMVATTQPEPISMASNCGLASGTLADEKAMYAAEATYNVTAQAFLEANNTGKLSPALRDTAKTKLLAAYQALKLARVAYKVGNTCDFFSNFSNLKSLVSQAKEYLPK
jgi:hypothetical protein